MQLAPTPTPTPTPEIPPEQPICYDPVTQQVGPCCTDPLTGQVEACSVLARRQDVPLSEWALVALAGALVIAGLLKLAGKR